MQTQIAHPFAGLEDVVEENVPLARFTWYKIGGPARYFVRPRSVEELREAANRCAENGIPASRTRCSFTRTVCRFHIATCTT